MIQYGRKEIACVKECFFQILFATKDILFL